MVRWNKNLTDEQRAALEHAMDTQRVSSGVRHALRAAFATPEPRTREGWFSPYVFETAREGLSIANIETPHHKTRVLMIAIPADADAAAVERVRRAAIEAMP